MRDETKMDVYTSGVTGAEYDAGMKQLMSNKEIIIPILQMTVPEFKTCSQEEILQCLDISSITKDDFVSDIPNVEKDLRLTKEDSELSSLVEKLVRFDIRFKIINPKLSTEKIRVNLHIDMEAQKSYRPSNPSYPILKRAVYYVARDLSSTTIYLWLISLTASKELSILLLKLYNDGAIGISSSNLGLRVRKLD